MIMVPLLLFSLLPVLFNLFLLSSSLLILLIYTERKGKPAGKLPKSIGRFRLAVVASSIVLTVTTGFILLQFLVKFSYPHYSYDIAEWVAAISLIFISTFIVVLPLRMTYQSTAIISISIAVINPLLWFVCLRLYYPILIFTVAFSIMLVPVTISLRKWHVRNFSTEPSVARETETGRSREIVRREKRNGFAAAILSMAIVAIILAPTLVAVSGLPTRQDRDYYEGERVLAVPVGYISSANPFISTYESDRFFYSCIYDFLTTIDEDGETAPDLAMSWWALDGNYAAATGSDFSSEPPYRKAPYWPKGSIWEYNLTEGVNWSDGDPFDADDVVFTIELQTENIQTFWAYQSYMKWVDHVEKVDQYAVRIFFSDTTNASALPFPVSWGASLHFPIVPKHVLRNMTPVQIYAEWRGVPTIGTGPFVLEEDDSGVPILEKYELVFNPEWERGLGRIYNRTCDIDKLVLRLYSEEQVLILDLKTKKLDAAEVSPISYLVMMSDSNNPPELKLGSNFNQYASVKVSHFNVITDGAPGGLNPARCDPALHRACALATDKDYIVSEIFKGLGTKGVGVISPAIPKWYYDAYGDHRNRSWFNVTNETGATLFSYGGEIAHVMDFNITLANELLDAAGYNWSGIIGEYRTIGPVAAKRLVAMGFATNETSARYNPNTGNPWMLEFEDILESMAFEDMDVAKYYQQQWEGIGVKLVPTAANSRDLNYALYYYNYDFVETSFPYDSDPDGNLFALSNYSTEHNMEYTAQSYHPDWWSGNTSYYDYCYLMQAHSINESERTKWVHECEKCLFLSGAAFLATANPKSCFGYLDWRWANWGNWTEHIGLNPFSKWPEKPLFSEISWIGSPIATSDTANISLAISVWVVASVALTEFICLRNPKNNPIEVEDAADKGDP